MTTTTLHGYAVQRDASQSAHATFMFPRAVTYAPAEFVGVSAEDARAILEYIEVPGGPGVNRLPTQTGLIGAALDGRAIFDEDGRLADWVDVFIDGVVYNDGGVERTLTELSFWESDGDRSWFFTLGGEEPSWGLDDLEDVLRYDAALADVITPATPLGPGEAIYLDQIPGATGTESDVYSGTARDETIDLGTGPDTLSGGEGDDRLYGGDGNDRVSGDGGRDVIAGGSGNDLLTGGNGQVQAAGLAKALANFGPGSAAGGWTDQESLPRLVGDIDGDGAADIVGFGGKRAFSSLNDGAGGLSDLIGAVDNFAQAQKWLSQDGQTRLLGDADGDGDDDIIGFGINSGFVAFSNGDGTFSGFKRAVENFANAQGWRSDNDTPRVMADVNGDGVDDIIGFGGKVTFTALGQGDGTFGGFRTAIENFSLAQGWASNDTFLRLAGDVNGDGLDDIIGFGVKATFTALSNGDGTFGSFKRGIDNFAQAQGWGDNDATPRLIGDVNGDGIADIVGFGGNTTFAALGVGDGTFGAIEAFSTDFNRAAGWTSQNALPRQLADIDGDGSDDIVGFSSKGVLTRLTEPETDVFVFADSDGRDTVTDFDLWDQLDFAAAGLNAAQALASATQDGADTVIEYGDDNAVTLLDVTLADLGPDNFA